MIVQPMQIHNLPPQPTPFIGREPEIAEIVDLLNDANCRLLTLSGPGGIGKTRLSIESINRLTVNNFEHGVFYVPLAPLTSADNIVTTVISVLGILIRVKVASVS
jgi:predicted ATPase